MKCIWLISHSPMPTHGQCHSLYFTISTCPLHQLRLSFAILFPWLESIYTPLWINFLFYIPVSENKNMEGRPMDYVTQYQENQCICGTFLHGCISHI